MEPGMIIMIKQVVRDCKICQNFGKSMVKPKVALPKAGSFNGKSDIRFKTIWE